jgi:hypothetical protein
MTNRKILTCHKYLDPLFNDSHKKTYRLIISKNIYYLIIFSF